MRETKLAKHKVIIYALIFMGVITLLASFAKADQHNIPTAVERGWILAMPDGTTRICTLRPMDGESKEGWFDVLCVDVEPNWKKCWAKEGSGATECKD
jgi:hypothetical protein